MAKPVKHFYEFGPFRVETHERVLFRGDAPVYLPPKVFDTLLELVQHSGHILEKDELIRKVWPDTFVEESNLTQYISVLRRTLGDERHEQRYIETVPRRGYRFTAGVRETWDEDEELVSATHTRVSLLVKEEIVEDTEMGGDGEAETRRRGDTGTRRHGHTATRGDGETRDIARSTHPSVTGSPFLRFAVSPFRRVSASPRRRVSLSIVPAAVLVLVSLAVAAVWVGRLRTSESGKSEPPAVRSLAVLPFSTVGANDGEYIGLGITDALISRVGRIDQIIVRPTSAVHKYRNIPHKHPMDTNTWFQRVSPYQIVEAGQELGVDLVLHGTVERAGERIKVTAQLVSVRNQMPLWIEKFEEDFTRVFMVQDRIAGRVIGTMAPASNTPERNSLNRPHTENMEAYEAYLAGLFVWNRRTQADIGRSVIYFQKAIQKDPDFALAHAALAAACSMTGECGKEAEGIARKALELDPTLGEAHAVIGFIRMFQQMRLAKAEQDLQRAIELSPNHASAHQWYALCLAAQGRTEEAKLRMRRALEIDPNSLVINADYGQVLYFAKEYDQAIEHLRKTLAIDPSFLFAHIYLHQVYTKKEMYGEAMDEFIHIHRVDRISDSEVIEPLKQAYESGGIRAFWQAMTSSSLEKTTFGNATSLARYYTYLGEKDQALDWLRIASEHNDGFEFVFCRVDPAFEDLRGDPRFQELVQRISSRDLNSVSVEPDATTQPSIERDQ